MVNKYERCNRVMVTGMVAVYIDDGDTNYLKKYTFQEKKYTFQDMYRRRPLKCCEMVFGWVCEECAAKAGVIW